ncbi:MAG: SWIM zinc finger family protein [Blastocatellia bacterium]|nr:SWIM zinc finger family protein [Blastocatellia bacterium]
MKLTSMTRDDIRRMADSTEIFRRGADYANQGLVEPTAATPTSLSARVEGNYGEYRVTVRESGNDLKAACDCPYDGLVCKHIVAVLLCYLDGEFADVQTEAPSTSVLQQTLTAMPHKDLVALITGLAEDNPDFLQILLSRVTLAPAVLRQQPRDAGRVKTLKSRIAKELNEDRLYRYYDDGGYDDAAVEVTAIEPILTEIQTLNPADQIDLSWHIVKTMNKMVESHNLSTTQIEMAIEIYAKAVNALQLPSAEKKPYFDTVLTALSWDMCGYGGADGTLKKALDTMCTAPDDYRYLIQKLKKDTDIDEAADWIAGYYLKLGDEANYLKTRRENLHTEAQFLDLAGYWEQKGNQKEYLATLESYVTDLAKRPANTDYGWYAPPLGDGVFPRLIQHYEQQDDLENLYRILLTQVKTNYLNLERYQRLRTVARAINKWEACQPVLMEAAKRRPEVLAQVYLFEKQWDDAVKLATAKGQSDNVKITVADGVKEVKPQVSLEIYRELMEANIAERSRNGYNRGAKHAAAIKDIYCTILKDKLTWANFIQGVRTHYKRLPALQDEFRNL